MLIWKWVLIMFDSSNCGGCAAGNFSDCFLPQCLTGDGYQRGFMSINRQLPGPTINVSHEI